MFFFICKLMFLTSMAATHNNRVNGYMLILLSSFMHFVIQ